jgi:hypothetical protein
MRGIDWRRAFSISCPPQAFHEVLKSLSRMGVLRLLPFLLNFANKRCRVRYSGNALMRAIAWSLSISPRPTPGISDQLPGHARCPQSGCTRGLADMLRAVAEFLEE